MEDEPHEVVKLLLARMESHPEEFRLKDPSYHDRWYNHMSAINTYGNEADKAALAAKVRDIRMGVIYEEVMEELLNGEDRRRKEEEEREYERQTMVRQAALAQQQKAYVSQLNGMVGQVYGGGGGAGIVGKSYTHAIMDEYDYDLDRYRNTPTGSITSVLPVANGGTDSTIINQIKNMLKKGK
jgi:hypothetical protein